MKSTIEMNEKALREKRRQTLILAVEDAEYHISTNSDPDYVRDQRFKQEGWLIELADLGSPQLFVVDVTTILEHEFEAGCKVLVEARNHHDASEIAWLQEQEVVGDYRDTSTGNIVWVNPTYVPFAKKVFGDPTTRQEVNHARIQSEVGDVSSK